jgi:hypothetical protein
MGGAITDTSGFLTSVNDFDGVCPNQVKHYTILLAGDRISKHSLSVILIQLEVFRILPVQPIILLQQFTQVSFITFVT